MNSLLAKLEEVGRKERKVAYKGPSDLLGLEEGLGMLESSSKKNLLDGGGSTFVTGVDAGFIPVVKTKIDFNQGDIFQEYRWSAHTDTINYVTYT